MADRLALEGLRMRGVRVREVSARTGTVRVLDAAGDGSGPPVVLLHGLSAQAADWAPVLTRLRAHASRVVAPDLPGHGASCLPDGPVDAEDLVLAVLDALDVVLREPFVVVGNSLGGMTAVRVAAARQERVRGLVLLSPGGAPMDAPGLREFMRVFDVDDPADAAEFITRMAARPPQLVPLWAWGVRVRFSRPTVRRLIDEVQPGALLTRDELAALRMPVLCLWGREDEILPECHRHFFRANLPSHAVFEEPEGYGHAPFLDRPGHLTGRIRAFLDEVSA